MLRCGLVRTNWLLAMSFPLLFFRGLARARTLRQALAVLSPRGGGRCGPPSSAGPAEQEEGQRRAPVQSTEAAHVGVPVRPLPDRSNSETTRNMRITVGVNRAGGNRIPGQG